MKFGILLLCLHVTLVLAQGGNITCSVPIVEPLQDTILTCSFPEDLNITKKDFSVYLYNKGINSDAILDCWWHGGTMECFQSPHVQYNRIVSQTLNLTIRRVTSNNTGTYACQVVGYDPRYFKTCDLQVKIGENIDNDSLDPGSCVGNVNLETSQAADQSVHSVAVGLSVGLLLGVLLLATFVGLVILWYKGTIKIASVVCKSHVPQRNQEDQPMLKIEDEKKILEKRMLEVNLEKEVSNMFPNIYESAYFVPPAYFNKTREKRLDVADQIVRVLEPPDPLDVGHDRAMQHVLNCLQYVAIQGEEKLFVRTQFKYTDYLNSITEQFKDLLPMPSLAQEHEQHRSFDFLIIHRHYGVMVGVVNDCSSNDTTKPSQVSQAIEQLNTAYTFVSEAMSDKENFPKVRQVLVLFNIAQTTEERLPEMNPIPSDVWTLCFEKLPDCLEPNSCLVDRFKEEWDKLTKERQDSFALSDKQYFAIIGRFCGPATSTVLLIESESYQLPKTLSDAVSLTGDMFERTFLYPEMTKLLNEPFLFLAGPPGTGKTRMLELVGRKWVLEGHPVYIISTSPGGEEAAKHLHQLISSTTSSRPVNVFHLNLNLEDTTSITKELDIIKQKSEEAYVIAVELNFQMRQAAKRFMAPVAMWLSYGYNAVKETMNYVTSVQEPPQTNTEVDINNIPPIGDNIQRRKSVVFLFTELRRRFPNIHMWGAGCTDLDFRIKVPDLRVEFLSGCLTCPPSVLREACQKTLISGVGKLTENQYSVPASGPPVKHLYHQGQEHFLEHHPQECTLCAKNIINFLVYDLRIEDENRKVEDTPQEIFTSHLLQPAPIRYSDILIFFESDVNENTQMVTSLKAKGIPVQVISHLNQSTKDEKEKSSVLVAKSSLYQGYKRKVVVFVEGDTDSNDISVRWNRLRCWTCCTSQLILVHNVKT